jgi:putative transposase
VRGYDGGKKIKGRKRQVLVDTQGFVLKVQVQAASVSDTQGGEALLTGLQGLFPRLQMLWTDSGYKTTFAEWVQGHLGWTVECVRHLIEPRGDYATLLKDFLGEAAYAQRYPTGFHLLPRRWVVERTFAWLDRQRRLSKAYDLLAATEEAWIYLASARLLWKRSVKLAS